MKALVEEGEVVISGVAAEHGLERLTQLDAERLCVLLDGDESEEERLVGQTIAGVGDDVLLLVCHPEAARDGVNEEVQEEGSLRGEEAGLASGEGHGECEGIVEELVGRAVQAEGIRVAAEEGHGTASGGEAEREGGVIGVMEAELVVEDGLGGRDGLRMRVEVWGNGGDEEASDALRGGDGTGGSGERQREWRRGEEIERERRERVVHGVQILRVEVKRQTLRVSRRAGTHVDLHRQLLLEDVALATVVIARLRLTRRLCRYLVAPHAQLRRGAEPHLLLAVRLERVLREHPVGARLQQVQQAQEQLLQLPLTPPIHAYQVRAPVAALAREQERLLRLLRGRGRRAVSALAPLQHVFGVEAQEQEEVPRGVATDAVDESVDPEGVTVLRQELALQRRQHLQCVVDGVGAEEGRERGLPHVQAGTAQLRGEFGLAGHRLGGIEAIVVHAVQQVGGERQHAVEESHPVQALRIIALSLADLSLEEAAQVERGGLQRGEVGEVESE